MSLLQTIDTQRQEVLARIQAATTTADLQQVRVDTLGKKGSLTALLRNMGQVPAQERGAVGKAVNQLRDEVEAALATRMDTLAATELEARISAQAIDITLPGRAQPLGAQHLISRLTEEICEVFRGIGYTVVDGREVETAYYNFTALNAPPDHPSRSLQDTFYVVDRSAEPQAAATPPASVSTHAPGTPQASPSQTPTPQAAPIPTESDILLRPQTSAAQIHTMEQQRPPLYILAPGRVYRRDTADPTHLPQFTQIEGLVVDRGITFGDLKGTLEFFCQQVFGPTRKTRFRPHFFPFTEPSAEVDVSCGICGGTGCRSCGGTGWLEILGCGMVDPNVYGFVDINPETHSGFAFGMGVERIACLKYNVPDLRMLLEGDMRFLRQF